MSVWTLTAECLWVGYSLWVYVCRVPWMLSRWRVQRRLWMASKNEEVFTQVCSLAPAKAIQGLRAVFDEVSLAPAKAIQGLRGPPGLFLMRQTWHRSLAVNNQLPVYARLGPSELHFNQTSFCAILRLCEMFSRQQVYHLLVWLLNFTFHKQLKVY